MPDVEPAQNTAVVEDNNPPASPPDEPTTSTDSNQPEPDAQPSAPAEPAPAEPAVPAPATDENQPERQPRPAERKINKLVQENKQLKERLSTVPIPQPSPQAPRLSELFQGKEQIMPDELDKAGQEAWQQGAQAAQGLTSLEVAQLERKLEMKDAINDAERTVAQLPTEYEELNPKSPKYNLALDNKIADAYQARAVRRDQSGNPMLDTSVKLSDIARSEVEFYREATEAGKSQTSNTLASQADEAAITPTSTTPAPDKSFDQMSLAEQEAHLRAKGHDI